MCDDDAYQACPLRKIEERRAAIQAVISGHEGKQLCSPVCTLGGLVVNLLLIKDGDSSSSFLRGIVDCLRGDKAHDDDDEKVRTPICRTLFPLRP